MFVCVSAFRVTPKKPGHELPPSGEATASIEAGQVAGAVCGRRLLRGSEATRVTWPWPAES